jgi:hypothetical protein
MIHNIPAAGKRFEVTSNAVNFSFSPGGCKLSAGRVAEARRGRILEKESS